MADMTLLPSFWRGTADELNQYKATVQNGAIYFLKPEQGSKFGRIAFDYDNARIVVGSDDIHVNYNNIEAVNADTKYPIVVSHGAGEGEAYLPQQAFLTSKGELAITGLSSSVAGDAIQVKAPLIIESDATITIPSNNLIINYGDSTGTIADINDTLNILTDNGTNTQSISTSIQQEINTALGDSGAVTTQINEIVNASIEAHNSDINAHDNILAKCSVTYEREIVYPIQSSIEITTDIADNAYTGEAFDFTKLFDYLTMNGIATSIPNIFKSLTITLNYNGTNWQAKATSVTMTDGTFIQPAQANFTVTSPTELGLSLTESLGTVAAGNTITLNLYAKELCGIITFDGLDGVSIDSNQEFLPGLGISSKKLTNLQTLQLQDGGQWANTIRLFANGYYDTDLGNNIPIRIIVRGD